MGELERCSGTQFDPAVVAAFETVTAATPRDQLSRRPAPSL